ncbi:M23 family metallopeptidase [Bacillus sp. SL00103]
MVSRSYVSATYGEVVFIQHPNGYETVYAHLHERFVKEGDHVEAGQPIGIIGNTGASRGTHLHLRCTGVNGQSAKKMR